MRKELKKAVSAFAEALRLSLSLYELADEDSKAYYHACEYSGLIQTLLLEQLLTDCDDLDEADAILRKYGLDHLIEDLHIKAEKWCND